MCCLIVGILLTSALHPVLAAEKTSVKSSANINVKVAYIHGYSSEMEDELLYLSSLENESYNYDEFNAKNLDDLWIRLGNYRVILLEISDEQNDRYLISALSEHKLQIANWIKAGGMLYVSLYGNCHDSTLNWLPDDLLVTSNKLDDTKFEIIINESTITTVQDKNVGYFTSYKGYTPLISVKTENVEAPIMVSITYGAGTITLSNGEFEKGFHPEVVEPMFVITASLLLTIAVNAVASYVISEYIVKPQVVPRLVTWCKETNKNYCDEEDEADFFVDVGLFVVSLGANAARDGIVKSFTNAHTMHKAWLNEYSWGKGLETIALNKAKNQAVTAVAKTTAEVLIGKFALAPNDPFRKDISAIAYSGTDIGMDDYAPDYTTQNTSYTPSGTEIFNMVDDAYDAYVDPILGYTQYFNVCDETRRLRLYLSAEVSTCSYFVTITDPSGEDKTPIPKYFDASTVEYKIDNPTPDRWKFVLNPVPDLAGKTAVVIIQQDKYRGGVLFDISHEERFAADGSWSTFADELRSAGFNVDILDSEPITYDRLDDYDVFVFGGWAHQELTIDEINAIDQFVNDGGGLLLSFDEFTENVYNPLSSKYGVEFMQNVGLDDPTDDEPGTYCPVLHVASTHPIFEDVIFAQFYWVHYLSRVDPPSTGVLFSDGDTVDQNGNPAAYKPMIAVANVGDGKVVSVADANLWNNLDWDGDGSPDIYDRDNLQLGVNIIAWLSNIAPVKVSGFGCQGSEMPVLSEPQNEYRSSMCSQTLRTDTKVQVLQTPPENLLVEYESVFLDQNDEIEIIRDDIAIYGTEAVDLVDIVPSAASLIFEIEPNQTIIVDGDKQLTWNIDVQGYKRIGYTISNITKNVQKYVQVSSTVLPDTISTGSDSQATIKYDLDMLASVNDIVLNFYIPKSTDLADISINSIPMVLIFDNGTHYRITSKLGAKHAGEHKTLYIPITITPKAKGTLNIIQQPQVTIVVTNTTFVADASSVQIGHAFRSTSINYKLVDQNITIADTPMPIPILTSPMDATFFMIEQGKKQQNIIQISNDGDAQATVEINLKNVSVLPIGHEHINASWISFSDETFDLLSDETKDIEVTTNVPLTAAGSYIGNIKISTVDKQTIIISILIDIIEKDFFQHINVFVSPSEIPINMTSNVTVNVKDNNENPIDNVTVMLTGAAVDVSPMNTGPDGMVIFNVYPMETGTIIVLAEKTGYVSGEKNIIVAEQTILHTDLPNVELVSADPTVTSINVTSLNLSEINETYKPEGVVSQSAHMINSTGGGNFTLRFTDIQNANMITAYKIDPLSIPPNKWIELDTTTTATNVTFTMSVGDLPVVFAVNVTVKVAFDETHNEIFSTDPNAKYSYSKFASLLKDRGYEVKTLNSSPITTEKLTNCSIFVIPAPTKPFDANEIMAIREFVSNGGNLLLINEWGGDFRQGSNLNDLSKKFGVVFNNDTVNDPTNNFHNTSSYALIHEFRGHYITKDINEFLYPAGCSLVANNSIAWADDDSYTTLPNIPLVSKAEKEPGDITVLAATNFERGRVVCIGDGDFCGDLDIDGNGKANIEEYDNKKLALNMVGWLSSGAINEPPIASFTYTPKNTIVNQTITFNASFSYDPDGTIGNYEWDFGDGTNGGGEIVNYSYCAAGNYTVNLIVTDDNGAYNTSMKIINVAKKDKLIWNITSDKEEYPPGDYVIITMKFKNEGEAPVLITNPITTTFIAEDGSIVLEEDLSYSISVTLGAGGQWSFGTSYTLPADAPEGYYDVRVSISGGNYVKTVEDLFHVQKAGDNDTSPPVVISVEQSNDSPRQGEDVTITVHVTDNIGVSYVTLGYDTTAVAMTLDTGDEKDGYWSATIPGQPACTTLSIYVTISDAAGNTATFGPHEKHWVDTMAPTISNIKVSPTYALPGDSINISADVFYYSGIRWVRAFISKGGEHVVTVSMSDPDEDGIYTGTWQTCIFTESGIYNIDISATDTEGNEALAKGHEIEIHRKF